MVLADPGRVHAEFVGIDRLGRDVGHELIGGPRIVGVVIVAQREVSEIHYPLLKLVLRLGVRPSRPHAQFSPLPDQSRPAFMIACAKSFGLEKQSSWLPGT